MNRKELKESAKNQLQGKWAWGVGVCFIGSVLAGVASSVSFGILSGILVYGVYYAFVDLADGKYQSNIFSAAFSAFTNKKFLPSLVTSLLEYFFVFCWSLLLIVPGIVKSYSYAMAPFIVKDVSEAGKEIAATQAISEIRKLMDGHKGELFLLDLSFLGWALLCVLTLGIGFLWLNPYYNATKANYYRKLVGDKYLK
jgi:uncharacterized membrane protein